MKDYVIPTVEVFRLQVESPIAASTSGNLEDMKIYDVEYDD